MQRSRGLPLDDAEPERPWPDARERGRLMPLSKGGN
jgi:hypothetical protein